jgi:hypothetical protein
MITDPATSPARTGSQIAFGCAVAALYAVLMELHIVFGLFYALAVATMIRGVYLLLAHRMRNRSLPQLHVLKLNRA